MKHSTTTPTAAEAERMDRLSRMPCIACQIRLTNSPLGPSQPSRTTIHHLVDKGTRKLSGGHMATIPLCEWHHQGSSLPGMTSRTMEILYGPSLALDKRLFVETYQPERYLLMLTNAALAMMETT